MIANTNIGPALFAAWLAILVFLFVPPTNPPGAAPVRVADVAPSHYASPAPVHLAEFMPLSAYFREPPTYEERFDPNVIGPDWAWAEAACMGCPIATGAVREQGIGE